MTGEEMERAIEHILNNQANFEAQLEKTIQQVDRTSRQLEETNKRLDTYAETQTAFIEICTRTMTGLAEAQARTDERLNALIDIFREGRNGKG